MARFRLIHPGNHRSSERIGDEFESVARYINSAEIGGKTIGELLRSIFDRDGSFDAPIEIEFDATTGLRYRIGEFDNENEGWTVIAQASDIRGPSGDNVGMVTGPVFYGRRDYSATDGQSVFPYYSLDEDDILVFVNGVLRTSTSVTKDSIGGTVTLTPAAAEGDSVSIYRVRKTQVADYVRLDMVAVDGQVIFPFSHDDDDAFLVFRNGIIQRPGGTNDYSTSATNDTITFMTPMSAGDIISIVKVADGTLRRVGGLMLTDDYTINGFLDFSKVAIPDGAIPPSKVAGLANRLEGRMPTFIGAMSPEDPETGWYWIDTSRSPNVLKFYNGVQWLRTSPDVEIPAFDNSNGKQYLRVNALGSALEFSDIDFSSLIPKTWVGAANGVPSLDGSGVIPIDQLPEIFSLRSFDRMITGAVSNGNQRIQRVFKQIVRIDAIAAKTSAGSCTVQITVNGAPVGDTFTVGTTIVEQNLSSSILIDSMTNSREIGFVITNASSAQNLEVCLAAATLSA